MPCVINPLRAKRDPYLPSTGILAVNPADSAGFASLAGRFGLRRHALFHAHLYSGTGLFLAGPAVGAPMAAICLEKLIALGARRIVLYGWCGSIHPSLRAGELLLPTGGLSEEGTSGHYPAAYVEDDEYMRLQLVEALTMQGHSVRQGQIWTTDAVYRETREKVEHYAAQGILAVDMEFTALRAVAAFRRVSLAAVMLVSDELFGEQWAPRLHRKTFQAQSRHLLAQLYAIIQEGRIA